MLAIDFCMTASTSVSVFDLFIRTELIDFTPTKKPPIKNDYSGNLIFRVPVSDYKEPIFPYKNADNSLKLASKDLIIRTSARIIEISNQFILFDGVAYDNYTQYVTKQCLCTSGNEAFQTFRTESTIYASSIFLVGHFYHHTFAHSLGDCLPLFAVTPHYLAQRTYPYLPTKYSPIYDIFLPLIGFTNGFCTAETFIFARDAYVFSPIYCDQAPTIGHQALRNLSVKHFRLDQQPPDRYVTIKREQEFRQLDNFDEIMTHLRTKWPFLNWEVLKQTTFESDMQMFNSIKLLFGIHGGAFANVIFMQPGSVICEVQADHINRMYMIMAYSTDKVVVGARNASFGWHRVTSNYLQTKVVDAMITPSLAHLNNFTQWPKFD